MTTDYADPEFTHATVRAIAKMAGDRAGVKSGPSFKSGCDKELPFEGEYFDTATAALYLKVLDGKANGQISDFKLPTCPTCRAKLGVSILKAEAARLPPSAAKT